jgi:hypothetical protein
MDLVDVQVEDYSKTWFSVSRIVNDSQRIAIELTLVQSRYPGRRVRAIDAEGRLIDIR